ncbi:GNAT family N-acetyltransferase [Oharaeibacter diazotrophicus]|uniref:Putative GNAT superfamily acetyltransferase n=2 Tax=Oharaeibacter diazotrophicus TaxID=1920512 RepID=A0A4R6RIX0_9HYPH|nr:GNAT family N-acetyltransferase [Oharaeibacter diazotrophicus]TDP86342.1 putative GNAT superfamily acetyltransferase [Oharaeibacter diazotrophicus]BBE71715.1 hypothetical protein OHA_1_01298 [Pleomorphomonas sp. SM30]GLS78481.1 chorismate synthase [Oharaeibacter diazotrophicus]
MSLVIRDLDGMAEFRAAEALQRAVWGEDDAADPADLMMVIQHEGGLVAGAFEDGRMLGYVFGFPTATVGLQHSHRLAVLAEARGRGLGARLKWYQADWCFARGVTHVRWTFDPLRLANAALNVERLGAEVATYLPDYYGAMAGINAGTPSDRLLADWRLGGPGVARARTGLPPLDETARAAALRIRIPADFGTLLVADPARAAVERATVGAALRAAIADGLVIRGFDAARREYLLVAG